MGRAKTGTNAGITGNGIGRGNKGIGAVVDIQLSSLRPLKQNIFTAFAGFIQFHGNIADKGRKLFGKPFKLLFDNIKRSCLSIILFGQIKILFLNIGLELVQKLCRIKKITGFNTDTTNLIHIAGADSATGGADLFSPGQGSLTGMIQHLMVGHDKVRIFTYHQPPRIHR